MILSNPNSKNSAQWVIYAVLALITLGVYWPVHGYDFVNFDDFFYVSKNPHVLGGLTTSNVKWAFTEFSNSNWHPLTWLSHMLDCEISQRPGVHHLVNVLFHIANTLLLFALLAKLTASIWRSAIVAALFAWHPLHVESVAWIAERKDLLSTFFGLLSMLAYVKYVRSLIGRAKKTKIFYCLTLVMFALALMSKPMLVTLPPLLLLLDFWPLGRANDSDGARSKLGSIIIEKIPFFLLAAVSCVVTFFAQKAGGAVAKIEFFPIHLRIANAVISYGAYLAKMLWPLQLSVFYPYRVDISPVLLLLSIASLLGISFLALKARWSKPFILIGWLWYLITLVPVIGLVQVGNQAMADRYSYIPSIGIFIALVWTVAEIWNKKKFNPAILTTATTVIMLFCLATTAAQVRYWKNSLTLFQHALDVRETNALAHHNLAFELSDRESFPEAILHYRRAIELQTNYPLAHLNLGNALNFSGKMDEAIVHYKIALEQQPDYAKAHYALAITLQMQNKMQEAELHLREAIKINPQYLEAHIALANLFLAQNRNKEGTESLREAHRLALATGKTNAAAMLRKQLESAPNPSSQFPDSNIDSK